MVAILIARTDGGVSIMTIIDDAADIDEEIRKWAEGSNLQAASYHSIDSVPDDRTFRNAWASDGKACVVDMEKARDIQMDRIREARDERLASLDVPSLIAIESGDTKAAADIAAQKQALRDIPQTVDLTKAETPEALAAIWPEDLTA